MVLTVGDTTTVPPERAPGFHVYEVAPVDVNVAELPAQMAVGLLTAVKVGVGFTTRVIVRVPGQASVLVPVME
jgi:hypothetical protein